jgi:hypothetical protein
MKHILACHSFSPMRYITSFKELEKTASFGFPSHGIYAILLSVYDTSIKEENI